MNQSKVKKGTLYFAKDTESNKPHPYIVISDPDPSDHVLVVNITTGISIPEDGDGACIIHTGELRCTPDQSRIIYSRARSRAIQCIEKGIELGTYRLGGETVHGHILKRIQDAAKDNDSLPIGLEAFFEYF